MRVRLVVDVEVGSIWWHYQNGLPGRVSDAGVRDNVCAHVREVLSDDPLFEAGGAQVTVKASRSTR